MNPVIYNTIMECGFDEREIAEYGLNKLLWANQGLADVTEQRRNFYVVWGAVCRRLGLRLIVEVHVSKTQITEIEVPTKLPENTSEIRLLFTGGHYDVRDPST